MPYQDHGQEIKTQGLYETSTTQRMPLGTALKFDDGRVFRYIKMGAVLGEVGKLYQGEIAAANHINRTVVAAAIGATQVTVNVGATAVTANQYADGYLQTNDATGEGYVYKIRENGAAAGSDTCVVTLYDPIQIALVASDSEVSLFKHPCKDVVIHPSPPTAELIGVPVVIIAAGSYGWAQTMGPAICLAQGTAAVNTRIIPSATVDGAVALGVETDVVPQIGWVWKSANVDTEYKPVFLDIWS